MTGTDDGRGTVEVFLSAEEVEPADVQGRLAAVIDVVRATSTVVEALANGARAVYPVASTEEALKLRDSLGREDTLLCGERRGLKIDGFDLGNSPGEFSAERVAGRRLVMSTTNGTRAFAAAAGASRVLAASFLNLGAVAGAVAHESDLALVCAGREGGFALDDVLCAGMIVARLRASGHEHELRTDAALAALALAERFYPDAQFLRATAGGRALVEIGLEDDLELCAQIDRHALVPEMQEGALRLPTSDEALD